MLSEQRDDSLNLSTTSKLGCLPVICCVLISLGQVGAVVVGLDTCFGFRQLCMASLYIQMGAHFVGTNPDVADRVGNLLMPGTGPILASIETASGVSKMSY